MAQYWQSPKSLVRFWKRNIFPIFKWIQFCNMWIDKFLLWFTLKLGIIMVYYDTVYTCLLFRNLEMQCICCLVVTQFKNKQRCKKCIAIDPKLSKFLIVLSNSWQTYKCTKNVPNIIWNFSRSLAYSFRLLDWHLSLICIAL